MKPVVAVPLTHLQDTLCMLRQLMPQGSPTEGNGTGSSTAEQLSRHVLCNYWRVKNIISMRNTHIAV